MTAFRSAGQSTHRLLLQSVFTFSLVISISEIMQARDLYPTFNVLGPGSVAWSLKGGEEATLALSIDLFCLFLSLEYKKYSLELHFPNALWMC